MITAAMDATTPPNFDAAHQTLIDASRIVVFSGAGMSAESGVPTFRGPDGLWKNFRPEQLATPSAFAADARLVWEWYDWRRRLVSACAPNPGHIAVATAQVASDGQIQAQGQIQAPRRIQVLTQNVDGLHERALSDLGGAAQQNVTELHGSLFAVRCSACAYRRLDRESIDTSSFERLPRCPDCKALLRPGVVWFGEALDENVLDSSFQAAAQAEVCVVVGTSALVEPAASLPRQTAASGGFVIEINLERTPLSGLADVFLAGPSSHWLPRLFTTDE